MNIRRIAPRGEGERKRVAAYCRVSTDGEDQSESYEVQHAFYTGFILQNPEWRFAGVYGDEGVSGTGKRKRAGFASMMADALAGQLDLILVKSLSRFSRNALECQEAARTLKAHGVEVRFDKEGVSSFDATAELVFNLCAAVAQEESRIISQNVRWTYQKNFEAGIYRMGDHRVLGYDINENGQLAPNADAWVVRLIFERFASGSTYAEIANELQARGAKRLRSDQPFNAAVLRTMLRNELYAGDRRMPKTGEPATLFRDQHDPLIDRATWNAVQARLSARQAMQKAHAPLRGTHHPLYGKVVCGNCGAPYKRRTQAKQKLWSCKERQKGKAGNLCKNRNIREAVLLGAICAQMGWEAFEEARFATEVKRVRVMGDSVKVQRYRATE